MPKLISKNKFAKSDYEIHSTYEAGISLLGWEVKSLRAQNVKLDNAFCSISNKNEIWVNNMHISQYMLVKGELDRSRKLLMHSKEILRMKNTADRLSLIIIPISIYWVNNHIKLEIALAKRLKKYDKREKIKQEELKRNLKNIY
ncbi:SsrA-binding protein SmpB [Mycoplasmopsis arginini]|uniref:SsrA-binding protein n=1 Tax=Mycoplasmopsis arginini TaxID=2094 RepID=A0ABZ2AJA4_MYCAR|nr:SsrA-binding protein SmpB [Mycoplasmopsis arginini]WVN22196.1 SsrA-binding protein SmpB [Mycoplasmopsis arginini]VEU81602.1 SsrA RNA (tmRNA)-binding protein [Mycoplasmopsis arginini]VEU83393.1 SsrA RNA (tmRNA)-binding protein [Mycoplasmopsis arginini]